MKRLIAGIMAASMSVCVFASCGKKDSSSEPYEKAVTDLVDAINDKDPDATLACCMPGPVLDKYKSVMGDSWDEMKGSFSESIEAEFGKGVKVTVDIKSSEKLDDLSEVQSYVDNLYDSFSIDEEHTVKEAYSVDFETKAGNDEAERSVYVYSLDDKWYVDLN